MLPNYAPIHPKIVSLTYEGFYVLRLCSNYKMILGEKPYGNDEIFSLFPN